MLTLIRRKLVSVYKYTRRFQRKEVYQRKRSSFHNDKSSIEQGDITILNIYTPNNIASKYMSQNLIVLQGKIDMSTIKC